IMALQDAYGLGLLEYTKTAIEDGGGTVVAEVVYDPAAAEFSSEVNEVAAADPDAIVLITFNEIVQLAPALVNANLGPSVKPWYFTDGNLSNYGDDFPEGTLLGTKGTLPGAEATPEFQQRLLEVDPNLNDF